MYLHPTYAVTPEREPLGILDCWMWAREKKDASGKRDGPKESLRWMEGYDRVAELAPQLPATRLVYVADREADMLPLMAHAQALGSPANWLVRAAHNRCLPDGNQLWAHTCAADPVGQIEFALSARPGGQARTVRQQLWARTAADVAELIGWYRARWEIEILFDVLKNACRVEALQLGAIERIERALALYLVVAWRIAHLMRLGRTCPDLDAALFFDPDEIEAAYMLREKTPPAQPRLNYVLRQIACVGGFLARKSDGEPGVKTIWLGLKDVHLRTKPLKFKIGLSH